MSITYEALELLLNSHKNIKELKIRPKGTELFDRIFEFKVFSNLYLIEWYANICYLHINTQAMVIFYDVEISGTWPNHFKNNLQFSDMKKEKVCILPLEHY